MLGKSPGPTPVTGTGSCAMKPGSTLGEHSLCRKGEGEETWADTHLSTPGGPPETRPSLPKYINYPQLSNLWAFSGADDTLSGSSLVYI